MKELTQTDWHELLMVSVLFTISTALCPFGAVGAWKWKRVPRATPAQAA